MKTKLVTMFACLAALGCGLRTEGQGFEDSDATDFAPDVQADEAEHDLPDLDLMDTVEPDVPDVIPETEADGEEDVAEHEMEVDAETGAETEDAEPETGEDDGGIVDPCARPDIPATGVYVFYCFTDDILSDMSLYLQIERSGFPIFDWAEMLGCTTTSARSMFCELPLYYNAVYIFNIQIPGIGVGWSCGPDAEVLWGVPRVWVNHVEQTVSTRPNTEGGCNHLVTTPPPSG